VRLVDSGFTKISALGIEAARQRDADFTGAPRPAARRRRLPVHAHRGLQR
jgi:hypothetical protein